MNDDMPRKMPTYVYPERVNGKTYFYFRIGKGKRTPMPAPTSPEFLEAYRNALEGVEGRKNIATAGTLEWLINRYRETTDYLSLSPATRRQRDNIFKGVVAKAGRASFKAVTKQKILQGREDRAATPAQARNFLDAMRGLYRWALDAELVKVDPTLGVKNPRRPKGAGFTAWTDEDVVAYQARWAMGTKERVWLDVLLYTGLRKGDAVRVGKQHVRNDVLSLKTEKTGMAVDIPILPQLQASLKAGPTGDMAFIVGEKGQPLTKESFGNMFRAACKSAGIVGKSAHGVRKIGATRAAEAGLTVAELESLFGWSGGTMASLYTRTADRKKLAESAAEKIRNASAPNDEYASPKDKKEVG